MKKWYRKKAAKAIVLAVAILSGAAFAASVLSGAILSAVLRGGVGITEAVNPVEVWNMTGDSFAESNTFNSQVQNSIGEIMNQLRLENLFETDGAYNSNKIVDIMEYSKTGMISGENVSGIAYTLEELESWSEDYARGEETLYDTNDVIVCEKPDGAYYYYYQNEFFDLIDSGQLVLDMEEADPADFLEGLESGDYTSSGYYTFSIRNSEGDVAYTDCWNFGQSLKEKYAPADGENLLQVVNDNPQLNGKLTVVYDEIASVLSSLYSDMQIYQNGWDYLAEGNTNLTYLYVNEDTKKVVTNRSDYQNPADVEKNIEAMKEEPGVKYMIVNPKLRDFETNMNISETNEWDTVRSYENSRRFNSTLAVAVDTSFPIRDQFYEAAQSYEQSIPFLRAMAVTGVVAVALLLISTVWITVVAGRSDRDEELHLTAFDHWKTELAAGIIIAVWVAVTGFLAIQWSLAQWDGIQMTWESTEGLPSYVETYQYYQYAEPVYDPYALLNLYNTRDLVLVFLYGLFSFGCFFAGYNSLVRRIKAKRLWKDSICCMVVRFIGTVAREGPVTAKAAIVIVVFFILQWLVIASAVPLFIILMLLMDLAVAYIVLSSAIARNRMRKGIDEIASGNMSYQIPLGGLRGSSRDVAEKLNDIGSGLNKAVEEAMRNERLKTDLITNVSHDIKTPLTSIINYVDILKRSDIQDPKIQGYLDILESKAQRLKTLTEDVVEASKVSSGNITLEYMDVNLTEMIQQTEGEFAEKFAARHLSIVVNLPEEPAVIHVDGRRMWRVLENIFGNAAKYAMPGTRVYADLRADEDKVRFSLKNISEQQLNISADELTERFIRGDLSRSTEGSGLGLSIAKSLTTMQGGEFGLYLDGDLFKVDICFPRVKQSEEKS